MFRTLFQQQIGLFYSDEKALNNNFYTRVYEEAYAKLNINDADYFKHMNTCQQSLEALDALGIDIKARAAKIINEYNKTYEEAYAKLNINDSDYFTHLNTCEQSLEGLHAIGIDITAKATNIINEYNKILKRPAYRTDADQQLRRKYQEKTLYAKFHYLKATSNVEMAYQAIGDQINFGICYFTEEEMLALDRTIEDSKDRWRYDVFPLMIEYYLQVALTKPDILENYAEYLCRYASQSYGAHIATRLNRYVMGPCTFNDADTFFPGWTLYQSSQAARKSYKMISLKNFKKIIDKNATAIAYWDYKGLVNRSITDAEIIRPRIIQLMNCLNNLIDNQQPLSALTYKVLNEIAKHEQGDLQILAQLALDARNDDLTRQSSLDAPITQPMKKRKT